VGGLLPAPGSLSSALRSRYRSNWPQWRPAPASHPARPARAPRYSPLGPPVKRRASPLALPLPATAPRRAPIGYSTCLSSGTRAHWLFRPRLPGSLFSPAYPESPPPRLDWPPPPLPPPTGPTGEVRTTMWQRRPGPLRPLPRGASPPACPRWCRAAGSGTH